MMDWKPNDRFDFKELSDTPRELVVGRPNSMNDILETIISPLLDIRESRLSGRIVRVLDRFMFLGEIVFDEHDLDPSSYNEAISNKDSRNWQNAMKVKDGIYMIEPYSF